MDVICDDSYERFPECERFDNIDNLLYIGLWNIDLGEADMVEDIVRGKGYLTLGSRMRRIGELLQAQVQQIIDERNLPIQANQYPLLAAIDENGPLAVGDLADALGVSQPGVTRSVGQLAKQGIVAVSRGKQDQRTKIVALTDKGRTIVQDGRNHVWPHVEACLADILSSQSGPMLGQLDALEDGLRQVSLLERVVRLKDGGGDG